jgi:hypothetical protein
VRQGLAFAYGALVEHLDNDQRADIDALIDGRPLPSELRVEAEKKAALMEFAMMGEIG